MNTILQASWSVVATIDEPTNIVLGFAAHHLEAGAHHLYIFLDNPDAVANALLDNLQHHPRISVFLCDKTYWKQLGRRPKDIPQRQFANGKMAYDLCETDWLLHCDVDEFLTDPGAVAKELSQADQADFVVVPVAERVYLPDDDRTQIYTPWFRRAIPAGKRRLIAPAYQGFLDLLRTNTAGHAIGKSFYRTGRDVFVGIHTANEQGHSHFISGPKSETLLAHVDGFSETSLVNKYLRRINSGHGSVKTRDPKRASQLKFVEDHGHDPVALSQFHEGLKCLSEEQAEILRDHDLLFHKDLGIPESVKKQFPTANVNFDTASLA